MFTTRPELSGTFGMVASTHWLASAAGMATLERGGNAFDAAVAAGLTLQVVEPHLNGPGGEVPIILHREQDNEVVVINGQGPVPRSASIDRFRELGLDLVPGTGFLAACVPGAFGAWMRLLQEYGTMRLADVMSYAIAYAGNGYPLLAGISETIAAVEHLFRQEWTESANVYLVGGHAPRPGILFRNPDLAGTYARLLAEAEAATPDRDGQIESARRSFYEGFVAERIVEHVTRNEVMDSSGRRHSGFLAEEDLATYEAKTEQPVQFAFFDYTVFKAGPWTQGPVFLQQLSLLSGFDLSSMGHNSAEYIHTVVECAKLAFADREAHYGDPEFVDVPLERLLDRDYADRRRTLVRAEASYELTPGSVDGNPPRMPRVDASFGMKGGEGEPTLGRMSRSQDTCHVDVVDRHGNMVSATPSGGWLQSSPVIPELGFCLGTRAQMSWLEEGLPNSLEGGKRPRTTLTPSLAYREGRPYLAFGSPGGDQQDQWTLNFFLTHVHFGLNLQESIDAPTFHTNHFPSSFYPRQARPGEVVIEARIEPSVVKALRDKGHSVVVDGPWSLGRISAVAIDDSILRAAANPRGMQGYAVGR